MDTLKYSQVILFCKEIGDSVKATTKEEASVSFEFVQGLLETLDSEWSKVVVRGLLSSLLSGKHQ